MDEVGEKRQKLAKLQLSEAEWTRVDLFLNLLAIRCRTGSAQVFLQSEIHGTPGSSIYRRLRVCTPVGPNSLQILTMGPPEDGQVLPKDIKLGRVHVCLVLNLTMKLLYFQTHWPGDLQHEAEAQMEETLHSSSAGAVPVFMKKRRANCVGNF
ncbi:hypothetical protein K438DRAFT_1749641 [Mycena galopus ATCC 62051]|nr:hypothetical protein K438DRAFT_1749641 [Mycena galopus ATCC 62051]